MAEAFIVPGYKLPTDPQVACGRTTHGFLTPLQDFLPQVHSVPPKRVLPIIFLPGIMGSNLRMSAARQTQMKKKNNIAWRPENTMAMIDLLNATPAERQRQLDPRETEVDTYDPQNNPTGDVNETSEERNKNVEVDFSYRLNVNVDGPLLKDDPSGKTNRRNKEQKARERGWGEVYFDSYRELLEMCEERLNTAFYRGKLDPWWKRIVGVNPAEWQAHPQLNLRPIDEDALRKAVKGCWFPVHAMGYNWLRSNRESGVNIGKRVNALIQQYREQGYQCEKVILVTHSMGGLAARAAIHPQMGKIKDKVLGIVHGVMPAIGAAAAYKRMRCGFEGGTFNVTSKVLGDEGPEVTAVLGNAQGGLELLPSCSYGNDWLQVVHNRITLKSLPARGDPYEEIYKNRNWYCLLRPEWINPAQSEKSGFESTCQLLDRAREFHGAIAETYHDQSHAHYGASAEHAAWHRVTWAIDEKAHVLDVESFRIVEDNRKGELSVVDAKHTTPPGVVGPRFVIKMQPPADAGDETVPVHSADHQLRSGVFKGIFRQTGYEHQESYKDDAALNSTLYCIVRIAQSMSWEGK